MFFKRETFIVIFTLLLTPILFKKQMAEIKIFSYLLFLTVVMIIMITWFELLNDDKPLFEVIDITEFAIPKLGDGIISSIAICFVAFGYQTNMFQAYSQLEDKSTNRFAKASAIAVNICYISYCLLGFSIVLLFGSSI